MEALKLNHFQALPSNIKPLPMQMVRLSVSDKVSNNIQVDTNWMSYQNQPHNIGFEVYVKNDEFCQQMKNESLEDPHTFFIQTKIEFQFTMVAEQQSSRSVRITGETIAKSKFYSELSNRFSDIGNASSQGNVFLNSDDINRLAREIYDKSSINEEMTADYVSTGQQDKIIMELLDAIKEKTVDAQKIFEHDKDSVFWDPIYARPDIQTDYMNKVLKYDEKDKLFHYNKASDDEFRGKLEQNFDEYESSESGGGGGFSIPGIGGINANANEGSGSGNSNKINNETETGNKKNYTQDDISKFVSRDDVYTKLSGQKFITKPFKLNRINLNTLKSTKELYSKTIITKKLMSMQSIPLRPDRVKKTTAGNDGVDPILNEELQKQIKELTDNIKKDVNNISGQLRNLTFQVEKNTQQQKKLEERMNRISSLFK